MNRRRRHPFAFANVVSVLALVIALGTGTAYAANTVFSTDIVDGEVKTPDIGSDSVDASKVVDGSLSGADVADHTIAMVDLKGTDHRLALSVGAISSGRCATIAVNATGARPGDGAVLSTVRAIPSTMLISAQRALTDAVQIKICNLSGATSAAITDLPIRLITIH
jgi:hypothetical protein